MILPMLGRLNGCSRIAAAAFIQVEWGTLYMQPAWGRSRRSRTRRDSTSMTPPPR